MNGAVLTSTFFAAAIEVIEMVAIVAAGRSRRLCWRCSSPRWGTAFRDVPLEPIRFVVGALLLVFGLQWLCKGAFRVAESG